MLFGLQILWNLSPEYHVIFWKLSFLVDNFVDFSVLDSVLMIILSSTTYENVTQIYFAHSSDKNKQTGVKCRLYLVVLNWKTIKFWISWSINRGNMIKSPYQSIKSHDLLSLIWIFPISSCLDLVGISSTKKWAFW